MARTVIVVAYDPGWKARFEEEAAQLHAAIGPPALQVHHIGSTAVPGLSAKPIIDILVEVSDLNALDAHLPNLRHLGYQARGENGIAGRRYFTKGGDARTHHLHAYPRGSEHVLRHLCVRDFLLAHPLAAAEYADFKRVCAVRYYNDPVAYADAKDQHVQALEQQAMRWHVDRA
jgi:GrpB-like predicted nucleotidyltransferase (UPF0157 family)